MKKLITLTLALILCLSVCACTPDTADNPADTSDGVSDTAPDTTEADNTSDTAADTSGSETDLAPTEDNVIWARYDVPHPAEEYFPSTFLFAEGEAFVYSFIRQKMADAGDKSIAVIYYYEDGDEETLHEEIPVKGYFDDGKKTALLTAAQVESLTDEMNKVLKDNPEAGFTLMPLTETFYNGGDATLPRDVLTNYRYIYGKDSEKYKSLYNHMVNFYDVKGGYNYPEENHED